MLFVKHQEVNKHFSVSSNRNDFNLQKYSLWRNSRLIWKLNRLSWAASSFNPNRMGGGGGGVDGAPSGFLNAAPKQAKK